MFSSQDLLCASQSVGLPCRTRQGLYAIQAVPVQMTGWWMDQITLLCTLKNRGSYYRRPHHLHAETLPLCAGRQVSAAVYYSAHRCVAPTEECQ